MEKPEIIVWKIEENHPYPWRFSIVFQGKKTEFIGIPNQCTTKREAYKRAWWRAKWMQEGTFDARYV